MLICRFPDGFCFYRRSSALIGGKKVFKIFSPIIRGAE